MKSVTRVRRVGESVGERVGECVGAGVGVPAAVLTCKKSGTLKPVLLMQFC